MGKFKARDFFRRKPIAKILTDGDEGTHASGMTRALGVLDLTSLGIAAIVGAGIFSTVGTAAAHGGPAVSLLFVFTAVACGFSALCYAQFASTIPVSGSAYTYAYASLGELIAWIIGWDLAMEYAIGNIAVAISWSDYFTSLLAQYGVPFPTYLSMDFVTAKKGFAAVDHFLSQGLSLEQVVQQNSVSQAFLDGFNAYSSAPHFLGIPMVMDIPALAINIFVTWIVYIGVKESKRVANTMVLLKVAVVLVVIVVGAFYVQPQNWQPFAPNGVTGVLKSISGVFFAYIGFDAVSTMAEECKNPRRDLPLGMFWSLLICTVLYVLISLVLTGMVSYSQLNVGDPLAYVFGAEGVKVPWIASLVSGSAIIALFSVLLVFQMGQPRIWMAMGRDGLLPKIFSDLHPRYRTPWFSTLLTGFLVGIPCLFMNLTEVTDLTSIGTLFAFFIVCLGSLVMDTSQARFKVWYINGRWIFPWIALAIVYFMFLSRPMLLDFGSLQKEAMGDFLIAYFYIIFLGAMVFWVFAKQLSLIPVLGATICGYLMTELGATNWLRFGIWLAVGLCIYFSYGMKRSALNTKLT